MSFWSAIGSAISGFFSLLLYWLSIFFVIPFKDIEVLWILIPIWINLIFADFFQEKRGTSLGNAVTNGAVQVWVGVDWIRYLVRTQDKLTSVLVGKYILCSIVIIVGLIIIIQGVKGVKLIKFIGRVRETSYVMLVCSPLIYNIIKFSWQYVISSIIFFPLFYYVFEMIDKRLPDPKTYAE